MRKRASLVLTAQECMRACRESSEKRVAALPALPGPDQQFGSVDEHLDTLFQLYRADALWALQDGMHDLFSGRLDQRDMAVMINVTLSKCYVPDTSVSDGDLLMLLDMEPLKPPRSPTQSGLLAYGNLIYIMNGQDPSTTGVWATVVDRITTSSRSSATGGTKWTVLVALCEYLGAASPTEALLSLMSSRGEAVAVQSPTYFRAHAPVLRRLQSMSTVDMPFHHILSCSYEAIEDNDVSICMENVEETNVTALSWLSPACHNRITINVNTVVTMMTSESSLPTRFTLSSFLAQLDATIFDSYQRKAIHLTFTGGPVTIIQGVPGGGKSFIGVQLAKLLRSLSCLSVTNTPQALLRRPIVVITYKNHALDEFLLDCDKVWPGEVVRFGGRGGPEVQHMIRTERLQDRNVSARTQAIISDLKESTTATKSALKQLAGAHRLTLAAWGHIAPAQFIYFTFGILESVVEHHTLVTQGKLSPAKCKHACRSARGDPRLHAALIDDAVFELNEETFQLYRELQLFLPDPCDYDAMAKHILSLTESEDIFLKELLAMGLRCWKYDAHALVRRDIEEARRSSFTAVVKDRVKECDAEVLLEHALPGRRTVVDVSQLENEEEEEDWRLEQERYAIAGAGSVCNKSMLKRLEAGEVIFTQTLDDPAVDLTQDLSDLHMHDVWTMSSAARADLLRFIVHENVKRASTLVDECTSHHHQLLSARTRLQQAERAEAVRNAKVVGFTVTGACINNHLLQALQPEVIIVEEAAEITEPQLVACLHGKLRQLILIGDHQQLPPKVEAYPLEKHKNLAVSLMQRLINRGAPYATLWKQNRMHPELSMHLLDIYPRLEDNLARVCQRQPITAAGSISSPIFWWTHADPDKQDRGYTNPGECKRAVYLALFLVFQGVDPGSITILTGYKEQTRQLRTLLKGAIQMLSGDMQERFWEEELPAGDDPGAVGRKILRLQVETIDQFQGDENDVVILSLVRSNDANKLGFMGSINRRCVATSRARCSLFIIGRASSFERHATWCNTVGNLKDQGLVGQHLMIRCMRHHTVSKAIVDGDQLKECYQQLCTRACGSELECCTASGQRHRCTRTCHGGTCFTECPVKEHWSCPRNTGHSTLVRCHDYSEHVCQSPCDWRLGCSHLCANKCGEPCMEQTQCSARVWYTCNAGHDTPVECKEVATVQCQKPCVKKMKCGHVCPGKCSEPCAATSLCQVKVTAKCKNGAHEGRVACRERDTFDCKSRCTLTLDCGHPCPRHCHQPCLSSEESCEICIHLANARTQELERKEEKYYVEQLQRAYQEMQNRPFAIVTLSKEDDNHIAEYLQVKDRFETSVQPGHGVALLVKTIEKIVNPELSKRFSNMAKQLHGSAKTRELFHGTSADAARLIAESGFNLPARKPDNMFGQGIYLATDSSKSAQEIYTKGTNTVILCDVLLGKYCTIKGLTTQHPLRSFVKRKRSRAHLDVIEESVRAAGFDSVFAARDSR